MNKLLFFHKATHHLATQPYVEHLIRSELFLQGLIGAAKIGEKITGNTEELCMGAIFTDRIYFMMNLHHIH